MAGPQPGTGVNVGAAQGILLCCALCCGCIGIIIYGVMVWIVVDSSPAMSVACADEANIWLYCATLLIISPILSCVVTLLMKFTDTNGTLQSVFMSLPNAVLVVTSVWGVLLWINMSKECHAFYESEFSSLLFIFYFFVIVFVVSCAIAICALCCLLVAFVGHLTGGSAAAYDEIPNEKKDDDLERNDGAYHNHVPPNETGYDVSKTDTEGYV